MQFNLRTNGHLGYALFGLIAVSVSILVASEVGHSRLQGSYEHVIREMTASAKLSTLLGFATEAEASQRGYLLTDRDEYLDVYKQVLPKIDPLLTELREVYVDPDDPSLLVDFDALVATLHEKLSELDTTLAMAQDGRKRQAKDMFLTDIGKKLRIFTNKDGAEIKGGGYWFFEGQQLAVGEGAVQIIARRTEHISVVDMAQSVVRLVDVHGHNHGNDAKIHRFCILCQDK